MEGMGFYTGILTSNGTNVPGLDDLNFPLTPHTQQTSNDLPSAFQDDDVVEVQAAVRMDSMEPSAAPDQTECCC